MRFGARRAPGRATPIRTCNSPLLIGKTRDGDQCARATSNLAKLSFLPATPAGELGRVVKTSCPHCGQKVSSIMTREKKRAVAENDNSSEAKLESVNLPPDPDGYFGMMAGRAKRVLAFYEPLGPDEVWNLWQ